MLTGPLVRPNASPDGARTKAFVRRSANQLWEVGSHDRADGSEISADDALALIDAGAVLHMIPPPGAPAYAAHAATGLPLLLQTRACPDCGKRVLFA